MNNCMDTEIQEMLPDLLHRTLAADTRARVEAHVASCEQCREELAVLRTVKSAAVFAPAINVDQVVRQIPPYQKIVPAVERPATTRVVSWLVAATMAIAVIGGGSLVLARRDIPSNQTAAAIARPAGVDPIASSTGADQRGRVRHSQPEPTVAAVAPHTARLGPRRRCRWPQRWQSRAADDRDGSVRRTARHRGGSGDLCGHQLQS